VNASTVTPRHEVLCRLAEMCGFSYRQAIYVPATVGVFAKSVGWNEPRMAEELFANAQLRAYFVEVIIKADAAGPVEGFAPAQEVRS
jgi:hypothetical protein